MFHIHQHQDVLSQLISAVPPGQSFEQKEFWLQEVCLQGGMNFISCPSSSEGEGGVYPPCIFTLRFIDFYFMYRSMEGKDPVSTAGVRFPNDTKIECLTGTQSYFVHELV